MENLNTPNGPAYREGLVFSKPRERETACLVVQPHSAPCGLPRLHARRVPPTPLSRARPASRRAKTPPAARRRPVAPLLSPFRNLTAGGRRLLSGIAATSKAPPSSSRLRMRRTRSQSASEAKPAPPSSAGSCPPHDPLPHAPALVPLSAVLWLLCVCPFQMSECSLLLCRAGRGGRDRRGGSPEGFAGSEREISCQGEWGGGRDLYSQCLSPPPPPPPLLWCP
jgi:hypothetical protein